MPKRCARGDDAMRRERARGDARGEGERETARAAARRDDFRSRVRAGREARGRTSRAGVRARIDADGA